MQRLRGKVAIVTGAAQGIGEACARTFHQEGAAVCIADIRGHGREVAKALGSGAISVNLDVRLEQSWTDTVRETEEAFGPITTLVNAAGILGRSPIQETSETNYRAVVDVNQVGPFLGMISVIDSMKSVGNCSIINISSVAALRGSPNAFSYAASKWALRGMTLAAAVDLGHMGIRVNSIFPGPTRTEMMAGLTDENFRFIPIRRMANPAEIAQLALFLASDESSFITGAEHVADGGITQLLPGPQSSH
jgi:3alpha(or 20beta)-hydroxysteroid dehydrogenase